MAKAAESAPVGMEKGDLRKFLKFAKKAPVQVAFAVGADGKAVIQMDKRKQPRSLEKLIKTDAPGAKNHRFGQLMVDPEQPKLARFVVNKAGGGLARKLIVALKGTGFNQVEIVLEDGTSVESDAGEEEEEEGGEDHDEEDEEDSDDRHDDEEERGNQDSETADTGQDASSGNEAGDTSTQDTSGQESDTQDSSAQESSGPDAKTLAQDLTTLVKEMMAAINKDPTLKGGLTELAISAQISLKKGDLASAEADMDIMRRALGDAVPSDAAESSPSKGASEDAGASEASEETEESESSEDTPSEDETSQSNAGADSNDDAEEPEEHRKRRHRRVHKSHRAWVATREKIEAEIDKLKKQIMASHDDDSFGDKLGDDLTSALSPVLESLEHGLEQILAQAAKAHSRQEHEKLMKEAKQRMVRLRASVQSNQVIIHVDTNPFMPLQLGKTISSTLDTLGGALGL